MKIYLSKIGKLQRKDIEKSSGIVFYNDYARICTVVKDQGAMDDRGDKSPYRMAKLFGGKWENYNNHFIVQVSYCSFNCPFCYVDNKKPNGLFSAEQIISLFLEFKNYYKDLKVLHLMGGNPGMYCDIWPLLRQCLDEHGLSDVVLFSDVLLIENKVTGGLLKPWQYLDMHHFLLTAGLKGVDQDSFEKNTNTTYYFPNLMNELQFYLPYKNFYATLIGNYKEEDIRRLPIFKEKLDFIKVIEYMASKK